MTIVPVDEENVKHRLPVYTIVVDDRKDIFYPGHEVEVVKSSKSGGGKMDKTRSGKIYHDAIVVSVAEAEDVDDIPPLVKAFDSESKSKKDANEHIKERAGPTGPYYVVTLLRKDKVKELVTGGLEQMMEDYKQ